MIKTKHILYGLLSLVVLVAVFAVVRNFAEKILKEELEAPVEPEVGEEVTEPGPTVNVGENITVGEVRWKLLNAEKKIKLRIEDARLESTEHAFVDLGL